MNTDLSKMNPFFLWLASSGYFALDCATGGVSTHKLESNPPEVTCLWGVNVGHLGWFLQDYSGPFSFNGRPRGRKRRKEGRQRACGQLEILPRESLNDLKARHKSPTTIYILSYSWTSSFSIIAPIGRASLWPVLSHSSEKWNEGIPQATLTCPRPRVLTDRPLAAHWLVKSWRVEAALIRPETLTECQLRSSEEAKLQANECSLKPEIRSLQHDMHILIRFKDVKIKQTYARSGIKCMY